ncbi:MAG: DnaJ domain-containing protein [Clostridium sp.]|nr:DnaJ domain-containing protein [Clostridium sp.]
MNREQAKKILKVTEEDDAAAVKRKYRRLMGAFHPDAVGSDRPEHIRRAQEINAAYQILKKDGRKYAAKKRKKAWHGEVNEKAFCDRNIYLYYSMDISEDSLYYQAARGKYMWEPEAEEFSLFLASIRHASKELLEKIEESFLWPWDDDGSFGDFFEEKKFEFQTRLFQWLAMEYIAPAATLRKLLKPEKRDGQEREIYRVRAFLGSRGSRQIFQAIAGLKSGDFLYPQSFQGSKIAVVNERKESLGHLSLEEDWLYFCVIPLLKKRLAQMKMIVKSVEINKKTRPQSAKAEIDFYFRLEPGADEEAGSGLNVQIADILAEYEKFLKKFQGSGT